MSSGQITKTTAENYIPALRYGYKITSNSIGSYLRNCVTSAPGLTIHTAGTSPTAMTANIFKVRCNDTLGVPTGANLDMPNLNTATCPDGTVAGNLDWNDGSKSSTTKVCRMYTFLCDVSTVTGALTFSVVCGYDFPKNRPVNVKTDINLGDGSKAIVGYIYVKNETTAVFQPGTTDLDAGSGLTVTYGDAFGYMPYNA